MQRILASSEQTSTPRTWILLPEWKATSTVMLFATSHCTGMIQPENCLSYFCLKPTHFTGYTQSARDVCNHPQVASQSVSPFTRPAPCNYPVCCARQTLLGISDTPLSK